MIAYNYFKAGGCAYFCVSEEEVSCAVGNALALSSSAAYS